MAHNIPLPLTWLKRTRLGRQITKARTMARNQEDLGTSVSALSWLDDYHLAEVDPDGFIKEVHRDYVSSISTDDKTVSLELAYLLWFILNTTRPGLVVDLGSGFSSFLFRLYQSRRAKAGEDCRVFSCDDNEYWLERTANFLHRQNLPASGLLLWDRFLAEHDHEHPDLVLHDLGFMPVRIKTLPQVLNLCVDQTIAIIDDVHKTQMRREVLDQIRKRGLHGYDLTRFTYDKFGRYAWMLTKSVSTRKTKTK
jgi:hypothetical protein